MITHLKPSLSKSQQPWSGDDLTKNVTHELEVQQKIHEIENCLEVFSSPTMQLNMSTFPRNKFHLHCQLLLNSYQSSKKFSPSYPGKIITTKCTCHPQTENESEKIDVDTEVEELNPMNSITKQIQTDSKIESILNTDEDEDEDEYYSVRDEINELNHRTNTDYCLSTRYRSQGTILTQNEVDRIASDGEHLLYFSETSKSLCYITNISSDRQTDGISMTKEITCRWPHHTILDLILFPDLITIYLCN